MGKEVGGDKPTSSYDDMVAAFGQPVSSTDSANPGDGVNVWVTDNGDIMAFFHNNVLTDITFRLKEGDANHPVYWRHFPNPIHQKTALERLENPMPLCVLNVGPAMSIKIVTGTNLTSLHKGDKIVNVMSAAETKRLKASPVWIKINNDP